MIKLKLNSVLKLTSIFFRSGTVDQCHCQKE